MTNDVLYRSVIGLIGLFACALCAGAADGLGREWDFTGTKTCGWRSMMGISEFRATDEGLLITAANTDPAIELSIPLQRLSDYWQVVVRMKASKDALGPVRFFWAPADNRTNERMAISVPIVADGEFHDYAFRVGVMKEWYDTEIMRLRFDPCESAYSTCVVQSIALEPFMAKPVIGTANPSGGVAFTVPPRARTSWADIEWLGDAPKDGVTVRHHFHLVGDGREHRYYFDGAQCTSFEGNGWRENARGKWNGPIREFSVRDSFTGEKLAIKDVVFTDGKPDIRGELTLTATEIPLAFNRVRQDFPVEVFLFNPGTLPVSNVTCEVSGLPVGVTVVNVDAARHVITLPGWGTAVHRIVLRADCTCAFTLHAAFTGDDIPPVAVDVPVKVGKSLGLSKASDYIPVPKPLEKGAYEIGAYYFCDWVRPDHWAKIWRTDPKRKPAVGWYDNLNPEVLDWQIKWAVENGISFYIVDWYNFNAIDYFNRSFEKARFRKYMKWALMWCNHIPPAGCREEVWRNLVKGWVERYFKTPEYYYVNGMPYVSIWDPDNLDTANGGKGGCKRMLDVARQMAREAGLKGIWFQGMANEDWSPAAGRRLHAKRRTQGFDETTVYHYLGSNGKICGYKTRDYADVADSSYGYWRELAKEPGITLLPNLATGWDDRPWNDGSRVVNKSPAYFRRICESAKRLAAETGVKRFCLAPLNEWGEGSYAEPNGEFGFGMFEAIRETFFTKPTMGWPLNYTPADVGRGPYPIKNTEGVIPHPGHIWR